MLGETIGNFKIVSQLGKGGMGEVYLAEQTSIRTKVAIKVLLSHISANKEHVQRFFNEAVAVSRIKHAGIAKIFDVGFHKDLHAYLVMEFLDGESLANRIKRSGRLTASQIGDIGKQIAGVLDATHRAGITHRDLKPDNIFLVPDAELASGERVKILDFGIAKLTTAGATSGGLTATNGSMGTPMYMAPEQWKNSAKVDWRADAYSLGCVAFEMACGRPPFVADSIGELCMKHLTEDAPLTRSIASEQPEALESLVATLLAKEAGERPATMQQIAAAFGKLGASGIEATMLSGDHKPTVKPTPLSDVKAAPRAPGHPAGATTLGGAAAEVRALPPRSKVRLIAGVGLLALGISGAAAVIYMMQAGSSEPQVATGPVAPVAVIEPPAPAPILPAVPAKITLKITSDPSGAEVYRVADGVRIGKTPFEQKLERTDGQATYLLKLAGHVDARVELDASSDRSAEVTLVTAPAIPKPVITKRPRPTARPDEAGGLDPFDTKK